MKGMSTMKISKILAAGLVTAAICAVTAVSASAFDPGAVLGGGDPADPATTTAATDTPADTPADVIPTGSGTEINTTSAGSTPAAGDVNAPTDSSKGSPNTGVEDIAPLAGMALVSAGVIFAAKKRK